MQDIEALNRIGLTKNNRKVYLALVDSGESTVSNLVKKTGMHRSYIYDILDKLIDLGLVGFIIKNNKKYFEVSAPEKLIEMLEAKEQDIRKSKEDINHILPQIKERIKSNIEKQEARIFIGKEGIKSILEDILAKKKDFFGFGAEGKFKDIFKWYFDNWQKRRTKLKISYKIIYNEKLKEQRPTKEQKLIEIRFLPEKYEFPATTIVYENKVAILLWDTNPIGFVIESKEIVKSFLSYFELLWGIAKS